MKNKAFTIVEILVVFLIIGILSGIVYGGICICSKVNRFTDAAIKQMEK